MLSSTSVVLNYKVSIPTSYYSHNSNAPADYFTKLLEDDLKAVVKPQYVDQIPKAVRSADKTVKTLIESRASMENLTEVLDVLGWSIIVTTC